MGRHVFCCTCTCTCTCRCHCSSSRSSTSHRRSRVGVRTFNGIPLMTRIFHGRLNALNTPTRSTRSRRRRAMTRSSSCSSSSCSCSSSTCSDNRRTMNFTQGTIGQMRLRSIGCHRRHGEWLRRCRWQRRTMIRRRRRFVSNHDCQNCHQENDNPNRSCRRRRRRWTMTALRRRRRR